MSLKRNILALGILATASTPALATDYDSDSEFKSGIFAEVSQASLNNPFTGLNDEIANGVDSRLNDDQDVKGLKGTLGVKFDDGGFASATLYDLDYVGSLYFIEAGLDFPVGARSDLVTAAAYMTLHGKENFKDVDANGYRIRAGLNSHLTDRFSFEVGGAYYDATNVSLKVPEGETVPEYAGSGEGIYASLKLDVTPDFAIIASHDSVLDSTSVGLQFKFF